LTGIGVCVGPKRSAPLRQDAKLDLPVEESLQMSCEPSKRRMYVLHAPRVEGTWVAAVHANCLHNEEAALRLRTLGATPPDPDDDRLMKRFRHFGVFVKKLNVARWTREQVVQSYSGRLRKRYQEALESLDQEGAVSSADAKLSAFLKAEKFNPMLKPSKPRMIMARTPRFNLELATYLKPLEHAIWNKWRFGMGGVTPTRVVGKGLNQVQRAALLKRKMEDVGDCIVFEVDGKAFEAHVSAKQLALEHGVYKAVYPGDRTLQWLLSRQEVLAGKTAGGIKYRRKGCRASGDFNTGLGNTLVMGHCVLATLESLVDELGPFRATTLADGDNCLLFVESRVAGRVHDTFADAITKIASQELTVEKPVSSLEEVTFGQCKPCFNGEVYTMVRDPLKVVSQAFSSYRHYNFYAFGLRLAKSIAEAELFLSRGVPILEPFFAEAQRRLAPYRNIRNPEDFLEGHLIGLDLPDKVVARGVTAAARLSFEVAWGIPAQEQIRMEEELVAGLCDFPNDGYLRRVEQINDVTKESDEVYFQSHLFHDSRQ